MLASKLKTALHTSVIFTFGFWLLLLFTEGEMFSFVLVIIFLYCLFGNVIYGIPVSLLSEYLTKMVKWRFAAAAFIHTILGALSYFAVKDIVFFVLLSAVLFFLVDEWRKWDREMPAGKIAAWNAAGFLLAVLLPIGLVWMLQKAELEPRTNDLYLIPKGYVGQVTILHDYENAPEPETEGNYDVIRVNDRGYAVTALPQSEGYIENLYYHVDENGNREEIPEGCISLGGAGAVQGEGNEYSYTHFSVACNEHGDMIELGDRPFIEDILYEEGVFDMEENK